VEFEEGKGYEGDFKSGKLRRKGWDEVRGGERGDISVSRSAFEDCPKT
jgi:hypothetical protein